MSSSSHRWRCHQFQPTEDLHSIRTWRNIFYGWHSLHRYVRGPRVAMINHFSSQNLKPINWCSHLQLIRKQASEGAHIAFNPRPWQDHHQQQTKQSWSFPNSSFCWLFAASRFLDWWRQLDSMQLQNLGFLSRRLNFHQIFQVRFQEEVPKGVELQLFPMKFSI